MLLRDNVQQDNLQKRQLKPIVNKMKNTNGKISKRDGTKNT